MNPEQPNGAIDVARLNQLKVQMDKLAEQRKTTKTQVDEIERQCVEALVKHGIRYIDESGTGNGPYWSLNKKKSDGSWNAERYEEFFTGLLTELANGKRFTPAQCMELAQNYLKQFETRKLVLTKLAQQRQKGIADLLEWLKGASK